MANAHKNTSANPGCTHHKALEHSIGIDDYRVTQRVCTACRRVVATHITEPAPSAQIQPAHEDAFYPGHWDGAPDVDTGRGVESLRRLAWSIIGMAIVLALITLNVVQDFT